MDISNEKINELKNKLSSSKVRILASFPFYGVLIMETKFFLDEKEKSFSTNGKDIFFNPNYLFSLNDEELDISILHEIFHILLKHPFRYKKTMNNDLYHLAADIVVNSNIMHSNGRKEPLYIKGKELPHLAPNKKEGYLLTTEEVYKMLVSNAPTSKNSESSGEDNEDSFDEQDETEADTYETANGPKLVNPVFLFTPDKNGKFYIRSVSLKDYKDHFEWTLEDDYVSPILATSPLYFVNNKLKNKLSLNHIDLEVVNKNDYVSTPSYTTYFDQTFHDAESIINGKKASCDYYNFQQTQEMIDYLYESNFDDKQLIKDEAKYSKFVHKTYLDVSTLHKNFFEAFTKERKISGGPKSILLSCRNAIAGSAKYDLNFPANKTGKDDLLYFLCESKRGICFHFATALTLMYRSLGIPARFVVGYLVNGVKDKQNIGYQESGHAWVEAYLDGTGWIRIDPTPVSGSGSGNGSGGQNSNESNKNSENNSNKNQFDSHDRWKECKNDSENLMTEEEINSRIVKAYNLQVMGGQGCGNLPGFIETLVNDLKNPQIDWRQVLNEFIQENIVDFTFMRPDNRFPDSEFIIPSFSEPEEEIKNVLFMIDCSGSMSIDDISDCFSEVQGALNQFGGKLKGYVGFFDTMVYGIHEIDGDTNIKKLKPVGRGGTDFKSVFKFVKIKMEDNLPTSIIILSDGDAPIPDESVSMDIPTLWVFNNERFTPKWGRTLRIKKNN